MKSKLKIDYSTDFVMHTDFNSKIIDKSNVVDFFAKKIIWFLKTKVRNKKDLNKLYEYFYLYKKGDIAISFCGGLPRFISIEKPKN